jgi:hypothetical protein
MLRLRHIRTGARHILLSSELHNCWRRIFYRNAVGRGLPLEQLRKFFGIFAAQGRH